LLKNGKKTLKHRFIYFRKLHDSAAAAAAGAYNTKLKLPVST
jgi:hypothetical protein